ncbi:hypothetical protein BOTBODRAFT_35093 [Botryobasidium botryosum FD-172 SS1]|uniref:DUF4214 domain-containing protein n=1 Tax=Botryobasidium botryosum (strain FD-172 SS1) TaxID=930990 RepID=A0A067MIC3_BOTB1|nr:hypothetical protein BOTBODRAFT_35093 [Botryobasidium botryosum FD-172 SS1]
MRIERVIFSWDPRGGVSNYIRSLHKNILNRDADSQGVVDHYTQTAHESGLAAVIASLFCSPEYRARDLSPRETVRILYRSTLSREADTGGLKRHCQEMERGRSLEDTARAFLDSPEYRQRVQLGLAPDPQASCLADFIRNLYQNVLDRGAESQEVVDGHTRIAYDSGLVAAINGFFGSPEYRSKNHPVEETVKRLYRSILGREAEPSGLEHHVYEMNRGRSLETTIHVFIDSPEYRLRVQRGVVPDPQPNRVADFVKTLYRNILDRPAESWAVIAHHTNAVHERGLAAAIFGFFGSPEYRAKNLSTEETVKKLYRSILGREAEAGGLEHHVREINGGRSLETAVHVFVDSPEYRARARRGLVPSSL